MNFYNSTHRHYCGIDLHARSLYVRIKTAKPAKPGQRKTGTELFLALCSGQLIPDRTQNIECGQSHPGTQIRFRVCFSPSK
ncbi:hypothetical protein EZI54_17460 [Marinobacter halodurans]|uniref:IS110 family transposase n=1 Tax=Marinobacter halodurans TaxID=2528979 RepID=A0ABY1ZKR7_9GAMM|nr:hypothetical protein EZI54_17460 [Marinobacter halodurans]